MKRHVLQMCLLLLMHAVTQGQSTIKKILVRDHSTNLTYQVFKMDAITGMRNDGKYEKAIIQNEVIGNDYNGLERIYGIDANADNSGTPTNYHPVDGYKRTFCGELKGHAFYDGWIDDDLNIELVVDENNPFLRANEWQYEKYKNKPFFFDPWNYIEGEVDVQGPYHNRFPNPITELQSNVCMYGSWVLELFDPSEGHVKDHGNNNEIHPVEQYWYKDRPIGKNNISYKLHFFVDNSGRFDEKSDFYRIPDTLRNFRPWSKTPLDGSFCVAFEIDLKRKDRLTYFIETLSNLGVKTLNEDGPEHYLIYGRDTLITVHKSPNGTSNIDFENVGYKPLNNNRVDSSILRGFLVIKSRIIGLTTPLGGHSDDGNLRLRVEKATRSAQKQTLVATIQKIKRLENNSFRFFNGVTHETYTDPDPIPVGFNEKQVFLNLTSGQQKTYLIPSLEKGQEFTFNNFTCTWEGYLSDNYFFDLSCFNGTNGKDLGTLRIRGNPSIPQAGTGKTIILFTPQLENPVARTVKEDEDEGHHSAHITVRSNLFEITYTVAIQNSTKKNDTR